MVALFLVKEAHRTPDVVEVMKTAFRRGLLASSAVPSSRLMGTGSKLLSALMAEQLLTDLLTKFPRQGGTGRYETRRTLAVADTKRHYARPDGTREV